jgi:hypothetical protein
MADTFKAAEIQIGYHPEGYRIDKTASAMNLYTRWEIKDGKWGNPKSVCFDSLPQDGWIKADSFDWKKEV